MKAILKELRQQEAEPMLSIVVSTQVKSFAEKGKLKLKLKNGINEAARELKLNYDEETARKIINSTKSLAKKINLNHLENGIGLYVAPGFEKLISFPFSVEDKVVVDAAFEVSDIQETLDKMLEYSVVLLSRRMARLFTGSGNRVEEIENEHFPFYFENQFQVHRTAPHSFYNMEESDIDQARLDNYYRKIEQLIHPHVTGKPIILMGTIKSLGDFNSVSKSKHLILAELTGNFDKFKAHEVAAMVWPKVEKYIEKGN